MSKKFTKQALNIEQQLTLLAARGLNVNDSSHAKVCLETVGYYRLSGYAKHFQQNNNNFVDGTSFDQIWSIYSFDRKLRVIVSDAIERIEVAFRTAMSNYMCSKYGPQWFEDPKLFKAPIFHDRFMKIVDTVCNDKEEDFIKHFYSAYNKSSYPPSWMIIECIPFGTSILLFKNIREMKDKKAIAFTLKYHPTTIESWMETIRYTRNLCAHHARLWNRWFVIKPWLPTKFIRKGIDRKFYEQAVVIALLIHEICPSADWKEELKSLFYKYPSVPKEEMGFTTNWEEDAFWSW